VKEFGNSVNIFAKLQAKMFYCLRPTRSVCLDTVLLKDEILVKDLEFYGGNVTLTLSCLDNYEAGVD